MSKSKKKIRRIFNFLFEFQTIKCLPLRSLAMNPWNPYQRRKTYQIKKLNNKLLIKNRDSIHTEPN